MKNRSCGFTLIELMITISLAGILVAVGVPSFLGLVERNQLTNNINQFVSSLSVARSESIKRKQTVALCASSDGETCTPNSSYENGWIVYVESTAPNTNRDVDNEDLIWSQEPLPNGMTLIGKAPFQSRIQYLPTGRIDSINTSVVLCKDNQVEKARALTISRTGRVHQAELGAHGIPIVNDSAIDECS